MAENRVPDSDHRKINLMVLVNSDALAADHTVFPAVRAFCARHDIRDVGIVDMQDNLGFFESFDPVHAAYLNVRYADDKYDFDTMDDYPLNKIKPSDFDVGWYRLDTTGDYPLGKLFGLIKIHFDIPFFNSLDGMLEFGSKAKLFDIQDDLISADGHRFVPESRICGCVTAVKMFQQQLDKEVVVKSFYGSGGEEVHLLSDFDNDQRLDDFIKEAGGEIFVQEFIAMERVTDDRIILMFDPETGDMEALCALRRVAKKGTWKANLAQGATGEIMEIDERHREMARILSPMLLNNGIYLAGVDILYDENSLSAEGRRMPRITEINVRNVGGIAHITEVTGIDYTKEIVERFCYLFQNHAFRPDLYDPMLEMVEEEVDYPETDATKH